MRALAIALLLAGCGDSGMSHPDLAGGGGGGCQTDNDCKGTRICVMGTCQEASNPDLSTGGGGNVDLAGVDLAGADMASSDLAGLDLSQPLDFSAPLDFSMPLDFYMPPDIASTDLAGQDLTMPDLSPLPPDMVPVVTFGGSCVGGTTACSAPAGESGFCADGYGTPMCAHTCNALPDWGLCESGKGLCVPVGGGTKYCLPKCGDAEKATCGAGAACAAIGFRSGNRVGFCVPNCSIITTSADKCMTSGYVCDDTAGNCLPANCGAKTCKTGATCSNGKCNPPSPAALYASCTSSTTSASVCTDDLCIANAFGGFCSHACDTSASGFQNCGSPTSGVCWVDSEANGLVAGATANDAGTDIYYGGSYNNTGGRQAGLCMKACSTDADCPSTLGWHCANTYGGRACIPDGVVTNPTTSTGAGQPGDPCMQNTDCVTNACAISTNWTWGICQRASTSVACPAGTQPNAVSPLICNKTCTGNQGDECPPSQVCNSAPTALFCEVAVCRDSGDCNVVLGKCDTASATCISSVSPPDMMGQTGAIGDACNSAADCQSSGCIGASTMWPMGYCSSHCTLLDDFTDTCPTGSFCSSGFTGQEGICLDLCDTGATITRFGSCRTGYTCHAFTGADDRFGYCAM